MDIDSYKIKSLGVGRIVCLFVFIGLFYVFVILLFIIWEVEVGDQKLKVFQFFREVEISLGQRLF